MNTTLQMVMLSILPGRESSMPITVMKLLSLSSSVGYLPRIFEIKQEIRNKNILFVQQSNVEKSILKFFLK